MGLDREIPKLRGWYTVTGLTRVGVKQVNLNFSGALHKACSVPLKKAP